MITSTEENYLKAIFKIAEKDQKAASTNAISKMMNTTPASVTDMIKRLAEKKLINYQKYYGATLTQAGNKIATQLVRKHRLWEVFLVDKLRFGWDEVHDIAEELEHIQSDTLINRLNDYLGNPKFDPHGDPIPNAEGKFTLRSQTLLSEMPIGSQGVIIGVKIHDSPFLDQLNQHGIALGTQIKIHERNEFDQSLKVSFGNYIDYVLSDKICRNIYIKKQA